jgi:voltage-gated potassium channel
VLRESISNFLQVLYRERVFTLLLAVTLLIFTGALGFSLAEAGAGPWHVRFGRGVWWALVTLTTVGYGDIVPETVWGRAVGVVLMLGGVVSLSLITATVASIFIAQKFRQERGLEAVKTSQHVLILGWHDYAEVLLSQMLRRLPSATPVVLINQLPPEQLDTLKEKYRTHDLNHIWGDFSREEILQKANVQMASKAVILADRPAGETAAQVDHRTLLTALTLKSMQPKIRVLAELLGPENRSYLERAGVEEVLIRGQYDSSLMAGALTTPGLYRVFTNLLTGDGQSLWAVEVPSRFQGRTVKELAAYLKERHQAVLIALYTEGQAMALEDLLTEEPSAIDEFIRRKFTETGMTHLFGRSKVEFQINPPDTQTLGPNQYAVVIAAQRPSQ